MSRLAACLAACGLALTGCVTAQLDPAPRLLAPAGDEAVVSARRDPQLTVMTLNLAHGRGTGLHQLLQDGATARDNLDAVAAVLRRERPDLVALQEADAPSAWSGGFDHMDYLARAAGLGYGVGTVHARGYGLAYGTALLSGDRLTGPMSHTFRAGPGELPKGFTVATLGWPGADLAVDVVSVHLAPLGTGLRRRQGAELAETLGARGRPLILMGDFNTDWEARDGVLRGLAAELGLVAWSAAGSREDTFPRLGRRVDWILVSAGLQLVGYRVLADPLSDHRAVLATVRIRPPGPVLAAGEDADGGGPG